MTDPILLSESDNFSLYLFEDTDFKSPVVYKVLREQALDAARKQAERELGVLQELQACSSVRHAYKSMPWNHHYTLVLEYIKGVNLRTQMRAEQYTALPDKLEVALKLTTALVDLHQAHVLHLNLTPEHILWPEQGEPLFCSPGHACIPEMDWQLLGTHDLRYGAPELTGRMVPRVDERTDLYALGVILYELFWGQLPFMAQDNLALIHAHMVMPPASPELGSPLEVALFQVVSQLLKKSPEARYQQAELLLQDLKRLQHKNIDGFVPVFRTDFLSLELSQLPERRVVVQALDTYISKLQAHTGLFLIQGPPGIGKSHFVDSYFDKSDFPFIFAEKYNVEARSAPYQGFTQALKKLYQQLLQLTTQAQSDLATDLNVNLDNIEKGLLVHYCPEYQSLFKENYPSSQVEGGSEFLDVIEKTLTAFSSLWGTFVLYFDDLQWSDEPTLQALKHLITRQKVPHLLVLGTYRNTETDLDSFDAVMQYINALERVENVELLEISAQGVCTALEEFLAPEQAQQVAPLIYAKTQGNPFYIQQFVQNLTHDKLLYFDLESTLWQVNLPGVEQRAVTQNVGQFLSQQVADLTTELKTTLQAASVIGRRFSLPLLEALLPEWAIESGLQRLESQGFIRAIQMENHLYVFAHDLIRQSVLGSIAQSQKIQWHRQLALMLSEVPGPDPFEVTYHFQQCLALLDTYPEKTRYLNLAYEAVKEAFKLKDLRTCLALSEQALHFLDASYLAEDQQIYFCQLMIYKLQAHYFLGEHREVASIFEEFDARCQIFSYRYQVYDLQLNFYVQQLQLEKGLSRYKEILMQLGDGDWNITRPPLGRMLFYIGAIVRHLAKTGIEDMVAAKPMPEGEAYLKVAIAPSVFEILGSQGLLPSLGYVAIEATYLTLTQGLNPQSGISLMICSKALEQFRVPKKWAEKLRAVALEVSKHSSDPVVYYKVLSAKYIFSADLNQSVDSQLHELETLIQEMHQQGFLVYSIYPLLLLVYTYDFFTLTQSHTLEKLKPLLQLYSQIRKSSKVLWKLEWVQDTFQAALAPYDQSFPGLPTYQDLDNTMVQAYVAQFLEWACLTRKPDEIERVLGFFPQEIRMHYPMGQKISFYLLLFGCLGFLGGGKFKLGSNWRFYKAHAEKYPHRYKGRYQILSGAKRMSKGQYSKAMLAFEAAIEALPFQERERGIAFELMAECAQHLKLRHLSKNLYKNAHAAYKAYGCIAACQRLQQIHIDLQWGDSASGDGHQRAQDFDLQSLWKSSATLMELKDKSALIPQLMHVLLENAGAEHVVLIQPQQKEWVVSATKEASKEAELTLTPLDTFSSDQLPLQVLRYILRHPQNVNSSDPTQHELWQSDPYFTADYQGSFLVLPLVFQSALSGLVFLEHRSLAHVFEQSRLETISLLTSQIAVALENLRLFELTLAHNVALEETVKLRTHDLALAKEEAESASRAKSRFLANMSHEIRTPLNAILGFAEMLKPALKESPDNLNHLLTLQRSGQHLSALLNDTLDMAKIESGTFELVKETTDLHLLVQDIASIIGQKATLKGLKLVIKQAAEVPQFLIFDGQRVRQVLLNLLTNAVKYTPQGQVSLAVAGDVQGEQYQLRFGVQDTGPGFPKEWQEDVFAPFVQLTEQNQVREGVGLGLSICKELVDRMDGTLVLTSEPGQGALFEVMIPTQYDARQSPQSSPQVELAFPPAPGSSHFDLSDDTARALFEACEEGQPARVMAAVALIKNESQQAHFKTLAQNFEYEKIMGQLEPLLS